MLQCRICLTSKRKLQSIFDCNNGNSFASMMMSLTNIKIVANETITEEICKTCCQKLIEAYNLKLQIESSDEVLRNSAGFKRIYFTNLQDKIKIEIDTSKEIVQQYDNDIIDRFEDGETCLVYKSTTIQKIEGVNIKNENEPMSVVDFLNTFKAEDDSSSHDFDNNNDDDYVQPSDDEDPEYTLALSTRKTKSKKRKQKENHAGNSVTEDGELKKNFTKPIRPVVLKHIRVLPTQYPRKKSEQKKKYKKKEKREMCNYCGKMMTSIKSHLLIHTGERSYSCDICSKTFISSGGLINHKKSHVTEKKFKCDKCVAAFASATTLKSHYISHLEEKKFVCDICSKSFKRKCALLRHKLIHNVANKYIKCDLCNMSFFTKYSLRHHLRIHTGERPYNCELCSQPYSYKHDFNRHCLKKHGIFLKRRSVNVLNEEVLKRERALMRDLMLKMQGITREGEPLNPFEFEGPQAALAFEQAVKALKSNNIPIDFNN